jgi:hypothetical protein
LEYYLLKIADKHLVVLVNMFDVWEFRTTADCYIASTAITCCGLHDTSRCGLWCCSKTPQLKIAGKHLVVLGSPNVRIAMIS